LHPLIIGGGPAGAAAALRLARAGVPVTLLERTTGPHDKVCGDFLSGPALSALGALGIDAAALGGAPVRRVRLVADSRVTEAALPFPARGLSRRALDEALLAAAAAAGARVWRGEAARGLRAAGREFILERNGEAWRGETVLLATGKHDLRGAARPARGHGAVGLKTYLALAPDQAAQLGDAVELVLLPGGYAGLQRIEDGRTVLCVMLSRQAARTVSASWDALRGRLAAEAPHLARRLAAAIPFAARPLAVAGVPYGHLHAPEPGAAPGLFRLGDQAAVIPSLAGDGVAIALASAALAARAVLAGEPAEAYHRRLRAALDRPMRAAMLAHRAARARGAQDWLVRACRLWPGLIGFTATRTRCYAGLTDS
jgi:flavin-dependent dehydrogenase